jgi:hypothetical protein
MRPKAVVALALVALFAAAGCGESKEDKALAEVCAARDDITKQVDQLANLTITTATTSKVTDGLQAIRDDLSTISETQADLADDRRKEVQSANDAFAASVRDTLTKVGTSVSLQDASTKLKAAFTDLKTSYRDSFGKLDCE